MRTTFGVAARFACVLLFGTALPLHGQSQSVEPAAGDSALGSPGDLRLRVGLRTEYQGSAGRRLPMDHYPRFQHAFDADLAIRRETPYLVMAPGAGLERTSEPGDLRARVAWRGIRRSAYSVFLATDLIFDTRKDIRLGAGKTVLAPNVYATIDLAGIGSVAFPSVLHYASLAGGTEGQKVRFTTVKPDLLTSWSNGV